LGVEPGDYVEIVGNRKVAYAQVWPAYADDEDKDIIRMDGILRQNAGVGIGDKVRVRKANLRPAQRVVIAPVGEPVRADAEYLKRAFLLGKPVWKGSIIEIPYYTGSIRFVVTQVTPGPAAYVGIDTEITVREEPVKETELEEQEVEIERIVEEKHEVISREPIKYPSHSTYPNLKFVINSLIGKCIGWVGSEVPVRRLRSHITVTSGIDCFGVLGFGGFGVALLCVDESGRNVVVKMPRDLYDALRDGFHDYSVVACFRDSFVREAEVLSKLDHIHIVKLIRWSDDPVFLVYEFCDGGDLRNVLSRSSKLEVEKTVILGVQVASALRHAYERGVAYHGDVKPSNILFTRNGLLKISDFGICRLVSSTTGSTLYQGSPGYSAPEQLIYGLGAPGPKSDVFSLGVVMYEALTGSNPFKGRSPSEYEKVISSLELSTGIRELDRLILRMLSFRPDNRPSIGEVIEALAKIYVEHLC
ncbi:MAG: protein kinase, partial [Crenarchaeota archaeon]|nr:protein kinase [Thermoproteota archaeon]